MLKVFQERLEKHRMIAAIKEPKALEKAIKYKQNLSAVILMTGNILTVHQYVKLLHDEGLPVILHVEKIGGLQLDQYGIDFLYNIVKPFAIVTTKSNVIKKAKQKKMFVIQRVFLIDTEVYCQLEQSVNDSAADIIEIMPCRAPDFIKKLSLVTDKPLLTGGLLNTEKDAIEALQNGAAAVTTSNTELWKNSIHNYNTIN
ncbi:glycerol-3-phosphate responsive antiterminator [Lysinibacillus sp. 3P01SB]|uniref:glycerol-3-phosphate responsive antiterminator n=1 Tax=Lysinibacillus sp. 3P01SB TaxID=3132284 RepID=UPI0039A67E68